MTDIKGDKNETEKAKKIEEELNSENKEKENNQKKNE